MDGSRGVQAGGKDGVVSVFGSRQLEFGQLAADVVAPPLLSHKLHKGWISDVQFVGSTSAAPASCDGSAAGAVGGSSSGGSSSEALLLLTAGNDGCVCLWDLGRAAETGSRGGLLPQCLAKTSSLHAGKWRGIPLPSVYV